MFLTDKHYVIQSMIHQSPFPFSSHDRKHEANIMESTSDQGNTKTTYSKINSLSSENPSPQQRTVQD